ncbi:MAG: helix-turn-helix transcriptional regulator [Ruminococcaceae bacterium]|nr:helix-turn-helix transcriptional regulator [Oscillospiraceae bacterium]
MTIGEKIKMLRTERSLTQTELAGEHITRNMLSLIESGSAQPSLSTILYIAEKLGVPAGYLLADSAGEYIYRKSMSADGIKRALHAHEYALCRQLCENLGDKDGDDELVYILAECALGLGKEAFFAGRLKLACEEFDRVAELSSRISYRTDHMLAEAAVFCSYMSGISPTLYSECEIDDKLLPLSVKDPFCRYALVCRSIDDMTAVAEEYAESEDFLSEHIRAKLNIKNGNFAAAHKELTHMLNSDENICGAIMYDVFVELEQCCREIGDFKGAYEYSSAKVALLERLLGDN